MQLKIVTNNGTFRFNQTGQAITEITEPFVLVEVYVKEDVVALYDQGEDHLANAFTYEGDRITGMSKDAADHIQNFFLAEGAWYLQELNAPEKDSGASAQMTEPGTQAATPAPKANGTAGAGDLGIFVPTLDQRQLLRDIQVTAEALRHIEARPECRLGPPGPEAVAFTAGVRNRRPRKSLCGGEGPTRTADRPSQVFRHPGQRRGEQRCPGGRAGDGRGRVIRRE